jgi:signal transduction histidine kinase
LVRELSSHTHELRRSVAELEERNRELERNLAETREKLATAEDQLSQEVRERAAINRSLERTLENFRNVLEQGTQGVVIVDHAGVARYANPRAAEMLHRNRAEMLGKMFGVPVSQGDIELDLMKGDGTRAVARMRVIPTSWEGEDAQFIVLWDVTAEKLQQLELNRVSRALNAVYRCSEIIVRSADEKTLLDGACQAMVEIGGYAMMWVGLRRGDEYAGLIPVAWASQPRVSTDASFLPNETACGHVQEALQRGQACVTINADRQGAEKGWCEAFAQIDCDAVASIPLIWDGRPMGVATIYSGGADTFGSQEVEMLGRLADNLSHGIVSLRTRAERVRMQESLRYLSARLVQMQEEERHAIARELHDEVGQSLTALKIAIDRTSQKCQTCGVDLAEASQELLRLVQQVRNLSLSLRPTMLDDLGLPATVRWHADRYTKQTGVKVSLKHGRLPRDIPRDVVTAAYRIVQEALTNVARHARAGEAMVTLRAEKGVLSIEVKDDGLGFDLDSLSRPSGVGLGGMRERVISIGGSLTIESSPGCGTYILAELPLPRGGAAARRKKR